MLIHRKSEIIEGQPQSEAINKLYKQVKANGDQFAFQSLLNAAELGNMLAQYNLGLCYENNLGIELDHQKAFFWYNEAAKQGYSKA